MPWEKIARPPGPQGVLMKDAYAVGSYCHDKVPAISESSLPGIIRPLARKKRSTIMGHATRILSEKTN